MAAGVKEIVARATLAGYLTLKYHKEMEDNYRKGDWAEAAKDTAFFAVAMTPVVAPNFFFGTLAPYWIGFGVGAVATAVIVEATGIGEWEDVRDLVLEPPSPKEWYEVIAPEVKREVKEAYHVTIGVTGVVLRMAANEVQKKVDLLEYGFERLTEHGKWFNPTPGFPLF